MRGFSALFHRPTADRSTETRTHKEDSVASGHLLHILLETVQDGVIEVASNGCVRALNPAAARLTGWSEKEAAGLAAEHVLCLRTGSATDATGRLIKEAQANGLPVPVPDDAELLDRYGARVQVDGAAVPFAGPDGQPAGLMLVFRQVARNRMSEVLPQRLASIVENSDDAIIGKTLDGIVTSWNRGAERMFGYSGAEMIGAPIARLIPAEQAEDTVRILEKVSRGQTIGHYVTSRLTKEGRRITVSLNISPIRDSAGAIVGASKIARDITHQRQTEERLDQRQKMEVIGQLAGGIAHDFNNLLTVINGYANLAAIQLAAEHPAQECLKQIEAAGDRAAAMTRQLLAFSRTQHLQPQILDVNQTLRSMQAVFSRLVREDIEISFHLGAAVRPVNADRTQFEQVLLNLIINAGDAMPDGGRITIESGEAFLDADDARERTDVEPGNYVTIAVTDSGTGIDPAIANRVFEPFFTTKPPGKGTGLGLSTVYGIVRQSGGHVSFYSERGIGTTFRVYLPAALRAVAEPVVQQSPPSRVRGTEVVLVVEDDTELLKFTAISLRELGYTVYPASPGEEALRIGKMLGDDLELLVTDVVMPGMGGRDLARALAPDASRMGVLYMSGYAENGVTRNGVIDHGVAFLPKPFRADELAKKVREALRSPRISDPSRY